MTLTAIDREEAIGDFCQQLQCPPIARLVQRGRERDHAEFILELADGRRVKLGTIDRVWNQAEWSKTLIVTIGRDLRPVAGTKSTPASSVWRGLVSSLLIAATDVEEAPDDTPEERTLEWLRLYLGTVPALPGLDGAELRDASCTERRPFVLDDELHIHPEEFARYLRSELGERITGQAVRTMLLDSGYLAHKLTFNREGQRDQRSSARYYRGPVLESVESAE